MDNAQRIKLPRMPDRSVVDCFKELGARYHVTGVTRNGGQSPFLVVISSGKKLKTSMHVFDLHCCVFLLTRQI